YDTDPVDHVVKVLVKRSATLNRGFENVHVACITGLEQVKAEVFLGIKKLKQCGIGITGFPGDLPDICCVISVADKEFECRREDRPLRRRIVRFNEKTVFFLSHENKLAFANSAVKRRFYKSLQRSRPAGGDKRMLKVSHLPARAFAKKR